MKLLDDATELFTTTQLWNYLPEAIASLRFKDIDDVEIVVLLFALFLLEFSTRVPLFALKTHCLWKKNASLVQLEEQAF